jgi:tRNA-binding EMAP/Myf-like protein
MSDFSVDVVRIGTVQKHPNADKLSITEVEGCPVVFRTVDFKEGDAAVYIPIESLIPEGREWVKKHCSHLTFKRGVHRLKAVRLRKVFSMGMLVPADALQDSTYAFKSNPIFGEDVAAELGIVKYEEPEDAPTAKPAAPNTRWRRFRTWLAGFVPAFLRRKPKARLMPVYEVSHYRKHKDVLTPGEEVVATEKIHGCNAAMCFTKGKLWVSSHRVLRRSEDDSIWWRAARDYNVAAALREFPDLAFYGEVFGPGVQDMPYEIPQGQLGLRFFDIYDMKEKRFLSYDEMLGVLHKAGLVEVPEVYRGPFVPEVLEPLSDGKSTIASHFREGIVIRPVMERRHPRCGRLVLKLVGQEYLLRQNGTERH